MLYWIFMCRFFWGYFYTSPGCLKVKVLVTQLYSALCDPMNYSSPGSSVRGILQARILVAIPFSRGSSQPRDWTQVSYSLPRQPGVILLGHMIVLEKAMAPHSSTLAWKIPWAEEPGRLQSMGSLRVRHDWLSDLTSSFHFHALEKEMATHSSVLAWRIPGSEEPGGLPSMGSHRVGHDWSDLAAAVAAGEVYGH